MPRYRDDYDDEYDDRPRRSSRRRDDDYDDDDDRPRRRSRRDYDDAPRVKQTSVVGVFSLIIGIKSIILSVIPCLGVAGIIGGGISLLLGIIGLVTAKNSNGRVGGGVPLAGTIVGGCATLFGVLWVALFVGMMGVASTLPTTSSPSLNTPADYTLTAVELDREYDTNKFAADKKYKDKVVEVSGTVERVGDDVKKYRLTVELTGTTDSTVDCNFSTSDKAALANLKQGSFVTIRGKCVGKRDDYVTLEECVIVPPESRTPDKPVGDSMKVTADELATAYFTNAVAADAKYKGKAVEVSGTLARVGKGGPGVSTIQFDADDGLIECRFNGKDAAGLANVKIDQQVTVRGKCVGTDNGTIVVENCALVTGTAPKPPDAGPIKVTADALAKEFRDDHVKANAKYHGKVVELTGVSAAVTTNPDGQTIINMNPNAAFGCSVADADVPAAKKLKPGATVTVRGTCDDDGAGVVRFLNCTLVK